MRGWIIDSDIESTDDAADSGFSEDQGKRSSSQGPLRGLIGSIEFDGKLKKLKRASRFESSSAIETAGSSLRPM
ncbi:hypothetical protein FALBO_15453 [Fusarium albosuccineum]|uniref:Uncharacterized protein n=1 Tax=Fusarium albosuccineum TaxID=1237068 RepID=A0A8H4KV61_9HYPO|nr:hypothetical protein FALBO_15453 [Fusarium albosuccineum]